MSTTKPRDPATVTGGHSPAVLLRTFLSTTLNSIIPLTQAGVSSGSKVFGAAVLRKSDLREVTVGTNTETSSPLLHGEIQTIQQFYGLDKGDGEGQRPDAKDTVFFATHEPCSLCLSGITWGGWDNFFYLFTYEDTRDAFSIPHDIRILEQVFQVPCEHDASARRASSTAAGPPRGALYNAHNEFFSSWSCAELLAAVPNDDPDRTELERMWERVRSLYGRLSEGYQETKAKGGADIPLA